MEAQPITLVLEDATHGVGATPDRVRLSLLTSFTADVESFLRGKSKEVDPAALDVAVKHGSLAVVTQPIALAPTLFRDLRSLTETEMLDSLDARRREVVERWQKRARAEPAMSFRLGAPFLPRPVVISSQTDYRADDADQWVRVERYVRGEILDLGGATKPNAHVRLPDGSTLTVGTEREVLRTDTINRLYKPAMLRIQAQYNVLTRELRDARLIEFVAYEPRFDAAEFERLNRRGEQAWKDVPDASAWVEELRGANA